MKPVKFKEQNVVFAIDQKEYEPLPALHIEDAGRVITCWKLSWKDLFKIIFFRKVWLCQLTFNRGLQPVFMTTKKEDLLTTEMK